jgi:hypothetical protein
MDAETITLDKSLIAQLGNLDRKLVFRDKEGNTLGYYSPAPPVRYVPPEEAPEVYAWIRSQIDDEELARRRREPGGRTTAEVIERLRKQ